MGKLTVLTTRIEHRVVIHEIRARIFGAIGHFRASTLVVVSSLANPDLAGRDRSRRARPAVAKSSRAPSRLKAAYGADFSLSNTEVRSGKIERRCGY